MPGYQMTYEKARDKLGINTYQCPHGVQMPSGRNYTWMSPVKCTYPDRTFGPMVPGVIARLSIPKQTYGYRMIYDPPPESGNPRTKGYEGMTLCIHGRKSHYKNKDSGMAGVTVKLINAVYSYKQGARGAALEAKLKNLGSFTFHAPVNKEGKKSDGNQYHDFGWQHNRAFKRMKQQWFEEKTLSSDRRQDKWNSCIEQEPWQRIMVVIRMDDSDRDFFTLGVCRYEDGPDDGRYAKLCPKEFYRDAIEHANIANLAQAADQLFRQTKSAPPEIVRWILGTPSKELNNPVTMRGSAPPAIDTAIVARPTALRPVEQESGSSASDAAAAALLDLRLRRKDQEADDFQLGAQHNAVEDAEEAASPTAKDKHVDVRDFHDSDPEDEPLVEAPVPKEPKKAKGKGKEKANVRPRSPDAHTAPGDDSDTDDEENRTKWSRANRIYKAKPPTKKVRKE